MKLRWLRRSGADGARWQLWPIRFGWADRLSSTWFCVHGWEVGCELVPVEKTSRGKIPGLRAVVGQTYHLGRLKICFGRRFTTEQHELIDTWARYQAVVALVLGKPCTDRDNLGALMEQDWRLMAELGRLINRKQTEPAAFAWGTRGQA